MINRRALLASLALAPPLHAQEAFPARPVRLLVPFAAGGPTDVIARVLAEQLGARWGQPVVVENKPGASTIIGTQAVAQAAGDGYVLGVATNGFTTNPAVRRNLPYDTLRDFTPLAGLIATPMVLVAHPSFPANDLPGLVTFLKARREPLPYTSPAAGGAGELAGELLKRETGTALEHISYNGSAPALNDVIAGRVPLMFDLWSSSRPHVEGGRLKLLAVADTHRMAEAPNYPTFQEGGLPVVSIAWQGVIAPAGLPPALRDRIAGDIRAVVASAEFAARVRPLGVTPTPSAAAEFARFCADEITRWTELARSNNLRVE